MKIVLVIFSGGWGGAENVVYYLAKYLKELGHEVHVVLNDELYPFFKNLPGVVVHNVGPVFNYSNILKINFGLKFLGSINIPFVSKILKFTFGSLLRHVNYEIKIKKRFLKIINEINPDIIHFHNPIILEFYFHVHEQLLGYPRVYTAHGLDLEKRFNIVDRIFDNNRKILLKKFDGIIIVSPYFHEYFMQNGVCDLKKFFIPNGLTIDRLKNLKIKKSKNKKCKYFKILFPGGDKPRKGGKFVIEGFSHISQEFPKLYLYIAGATTKNSELKKLVKDKKLEKRIFFLGLLTKERYLKLLMHMDALVLPDDDNWPGLVALEALSFGVPLLTTKLKYTHGIFKEYHNYIPIQKEPKDIADKLRLIYLNPKVRKKLTTTVNTKEKLKFLEWVRVAKHHVKVYNLVSSIDTHK